jgi:hypothetical protein
LTFRFSGATFQPDVNQDFPNARCPPLRRPDRGARGLLGQPGARHQSRRIGHYLDACADGSIFDVPKLQKDLAARPGLTVKKVASPTPDVLEVELAYHSVEEVYGSVESVKKSGLLVYTVSGGQKSLKVHIDRKNFKELSAVFPAMNSTAFEGIAPQEQDTITESEYLEMIQFTLGPDGPAALKGSFFDLVVKPEGTIASQTGGTVKNGSVTFRIPLIRLLLLDKPLDYSLVWK